MLGVLLRLYVSPVLSSALCTQSPMSLIKARALALRLPSCSHTNTEQHTHTRTHSGKSIKMIHTEEKILHSSRENVKRLQTTFPHDVIFGNKEVRINPRAIQRYLYYNLIIHKERLNRMFSALYVCLVTCGN